MGCGSDRKYMERVVEQHLAECRVEARAQGREEWPDVRDDAAGQVVPCTCCHESFAYEAHLSSKQSSLCIAAKPGKWSTNSLSLFQTRLRPISQQRPSMTFVVCGHKLHQKAAGPRQAASSELSNQVGVGGARGRELEQ